MADLLLLDSGEQAFTWGAGDFVVEGDVRSRYIAALRDADLLNYAPLLAFLRASD